jgi:sulfatase maturation enzyme AslB (radical SAM superfamily)
LKTLRSIVFYGGEPLLSKKMWKVLEIAVELGYAKNISLEYNTNGTVWHGATEVWKDFKKVSLSFSIDGVKDQFEYMRFPAEWEKVVENMNKAREFKEKYKNMSCSWCVTLSPLNIFYVREILDEHYVNFRDFGIYLNLVHGPEHYNINQIPDQYKQVIIDKLLNIPAAYNVHFYIPGIVEFIRNGVAKPKHWAKLLSETKTGDTYRGQSYSKTFPEFSQITGIGYE